MDTFKTRMWSEFLDHSSHSPPNSDARLMMSIFDIVDISKGPLESLSRSFKFVNSNPELAREEFLEALWSHATIDEDYSGEARCFVNPPKYLKNIPVKGTYISSGLNPSSSYISLRNLDPKSSDFVLGSVVSGVEPGFLNEVVIFNGGSMLSGDISALVHLLSKRICPGVTVIIFEMPESDLDQMLGFFDLHPDIERGAILKGLAQETGFSFTQIEIKTNKLRTTAYYGASS